MASSIAPLNLNSVENIVFQTTAESETDYDTPPRKIKRLDINPLIEFMIEEEWFYAQFFPFQSLKEVTKLDSALTCHTIRNLWLSCPKLIFKEIQLYDNVHVDWCKQRNIHIINISIGSVARAAAITNESMLILGEQCKSLQHVTIQNSQSFTDDGFAAFIRNCCSCLESVCFNSCVAVTDLNLAILGASCKNKLVDIRLINCQRGVTDVGFRELLKGCNRLKSFEFILNDEGGILFNFISILTYLGQYCPLLESIIMNRVIIKAIGFSAFTTGCKLLKYIELNPVGGLTDEIFIIIGSNCPWLESLHCADILSVYDAGDITDVGIKALFNGCAYLKSLIPYHITTRAITDKAFTNVSILCSQLERIMICRTEITGLTLLELGQLKHLRCLYLYGNNNIIDDGMMSLVSGSGSCHANNSSSSSSYSSSSSSYLFNPQEYHNNRTVPPFASSSSSSLSSSSIEKLSFQVDGVRITEATIYNIATYCPQLRSIKIYDKHGSVSSQSIEYLVNTCLLLKCIKGSVIVSSETRQIMTTRSEMVMIVQQQKLNDMRAKTSPATSLAAVSAAVVI